MEPSQNNNGLTPFSALDKSAKTPMTGAHRVSDANPNEELTVSIRLRPKTDDGNLPLNNLTEPSPVQRKYVTRDDYAEKYGAATADIDQIAMFAKTNMLKIVETSKARRTVVLSGTVEQMNKAFAVNLGNYQTSTQVYRGREGAVNVPTSLARIIESVHGLDNRPVASPQFRMAAQNIAVAQNTAPLTPPQVSRLYNFPTGSAAGQTIAILEFGGGFKPADITNYFTNVLHAPVPAITVVGVDGANNSPGNAADLEVVLDIDVSAGAAPGAKLVVYFAPNTIQGFIDAITTAVHDTVNKPSVISISWAGGESGWGPAIQNVSTALREAAALGVTVFVSSGDNGAQNPAQVLYPASDPWVIACGGTTVQNVSGNNFTESVWGGSGGGVSNVFPRPYWQTWAGIPASVNPVGHIGRGVPDVAGNADPASGYQLIINGAQTGPVGGTSAVAPLYAGLTALLNATTGQPAGYLNYNLYAFAGPYVYRDITIGNNGLYHATTGWDACTGFGSINGNAMATSLWGVALPPALCTFNNKLMMCWKGIERDDRIFTSSFNGSTWAPQQLIPNIATSSGVSVAVLNNIVYMAWKGMNDDQGIYYSCFNGSSWIPQRQVAGIATSTGPRLAVYNGKLYMAWKGLEGDQALYWSSFNGTTWAAQQNIHNVASSVGPSLCVFNGLLYASWKGMYGDQGLYYATFNGTAWSAQTNIPGVGSSNGPSLAVYGNKLFAAWRGQLNDERLFFSSFNGTMWAPQQQIPGVASSIGPGIFAMGSNLFAAWKGMLGDEHIWYSHFNGSTWAPQQVVPGVGTSGDLITQLEKQDLGNLVVT
jgi:kumamolisin